MDSYVNRELLELVAGAFPADLDRAGIFGHSMGGHGALVSAFRNPRRYRSVSAFAPIAAPSRCPWGTKAFTGYLGTDQAKWVGYDASELVSRGPLPTEILIDQGMADQFLARELYPDVFEAAAKKAGQKLTLRRQPGYDHGYYFIQTFIADHLQHHARILGA
jgi:S-formylglutathione hydrolase